MKDIRPSGSFWETQSIRDDSFHGVDPEGNYIIGYEQRLTAEGLGPISPTDAVSFRDLYYQSPIDLSNGPEHVTGEIAVGQLLVGAKLTVRQYRIIKALVDSEGDFTGIGDELTIVADRFEGTPLRDTHRRAAASIRGINSSDESIFDMNPKVARWGIEKESVEEQAKLKDVIEANFRHLHGGVPKKQQVLYSMIRSVTKQFVKDDPTHQDRMAVQRILLGYWSFYTFDRITRESQYPPGLMDKEYMRTVRRRIVRDAVNYLRETMSSMEPPSLQRPDDEVHNNPTLSHAMDWCELGQRQMRAEQHKAELSSQLTVGPGWLQHTQQQDKLNELEKVEDTVDTESGPSLLGWLFKRRRREID